VAGVDPNVAELAAADVVAQIEARLVGQLSDAALADWAFDQFYALELGLRRLPAADEDVLREALDTLMFADMADFHLSEAELRALAARLRNR
jgi:hypothetical protein